MKNKKKQAGVNDRKKTVTYTYRISCTNCSGREGCYTRAISYSPPNYKCHTLDDSYVKVNKTHVKFRPQEQLLDIDFMLDNIS